jgi:prepilin-type N-terminal cleavage/methylation domain-containing protein
LLGETPIRRRAGSAKRGFTLVEVIVVLVILAILAAIAIPALTGYIDKAKYKGYIQEARNIVMAYQTVYSEHWYDPTWEDGWYTYHSIGSPSIGWSYLVNMKQEMWWSGSDVHYTYWNNGGASVDLDTGIYTPPTKAKCGYVELAALTAGSSSVQWAFTCLSSFVDSSGAIKTWFYYVPASYDATLGGGNSSFRYVVTNNYDISNSVPYVPDAGIQVWFQESAGVWSKVE